MISEFLVFWFKKRALYITNFVLYHILLICNITTWQDGHVGGRYNRYVFGLNVHENGLMFPAERNALLLTNNMASVMWCQVQPSNTFTAPRMLHCEIQPMYAHVLLKKTYVIVRCAIGRAYGLLVRWATIYAHAASIVRPKRLTKAVIMA